MTLRTPRRRISPQTRRRCKAIKGFFKRALGSVSQPDLLQITSSIAVNVTDLNHKIVGLEQHLSEVSKLCREHRRECHSERSRSPVLTESQNEATQQKIHRQGSELRSKETNVIYTKSENRSKTSSKSDHARALTTNYESNKVKSDSMNADSHNERLHKLRKKKSKAENRTDIDSNFRRRGAESAHKTFVSAYSTSSFHSLDQLRKLYQSKPGYSGDGDEKINLTKLPNDLYRNKTCRDLSPDRYEYKQYKEEKPHKIAKNKKPKHDFTELDPDFIADIIKRQYKPVKFGRRHSDLSQFSTPVCRDLEYCHNADLRIPEEHEHRNFRGHYYDPNTHHSDCSDIRSVCDARLYKVKRNPRTKRNRRQPDIYEHSEIYDLVPVKQKSSPKSRRKFIEENMQSACYKEVPPSPKSHRPQLNLNAQYTECNNIMDNVRNYETCVSPKYPTPSQKTKEMYHQLIDRDKITSPESIMRIQRNEQFDEKYNFVEIKNTKTHNNLNRQQADLLHEHSIMSGLYPPLATEYPTVTVETFNKTQETVTSDKTDKALCEIKDILQSFLLEIKKEGTSSHNAKPAGTKMSENGNGPPPNDASVMTHHGHSFSNFSSAHCPMAQSPYLAPTLPAFGNPCVYPVVPICPINCNACLQNSNCMQNRYPMPSTSCTCNNSYDRCNETRNSQNANKCDAANEPLSCETDELIKEIYKFVSQSPQFSKKNQVSKKSRSKNPSFHDNKLLTSRSAGGSTCLRRQDAKVGTTNMNCASKSCEAIRAKLSTEVDSSDTNATYSDTVLDKLSLQAAQSNSETEFSTEPSNVDKARNSRFSKVLKSFGLRKKIKKDIIEELSESESTIDAEVKKKPQFRQHIANYAMYDQEYYRSPPVSPNFRPNYPQDYRQHYNPDDPYRDPRMQQSRSHGYATPHLQYQPREYSTAPPHSQCYDSYSHHPMQPQVPLCLKEVEVKSIGCQSERKISFFKRITQKVQQPSESTQSESLKHDSTQTANGKPPPLFNWKTPPSKQKDIDPLRYGYETQKKLAFGDVKMRNAMLKKLFYKRNPFSPRNLIVKTLLGKDKSSYGDPPSAFRPRMFF